MAETGDYRWLTVTLPGENVSIVLVSVPGPPIIDDESKDQINVLMGKGLAGAIFFTSNDVYAEYERLKAKGVEFNDEPFEQPHGIDVGFRDPSGNNFRLTQVTADLTAG